MPAAATRSAEAEFVNADLHERDQLGAIRDAALRSEAARAWADAERTARIRAGQSFVSETVFSHPSKLQLIAEARAAGFEVVLYVVCLDEPRRLLARVQQRVREGGHAVPANKVLQRYPKTLENLREAVLQAHLAMLFDGTDTDAGGPHLVASVVAGEVRPHGPWLPAWARQVLGFGAPG